MCFPKIIIDTLISVIVDSSMNREFYHTLGVAFGLNEIPRSRHWWGHIDLNPSINSYDQAHCFIWGVISHQNAV